MDHRERLAWARRHLDTLDKAIRGFLDDNPYEMRTEPNPEGGEGRYRGVLVVKREPPANEWTLLAGDIVHSLRSALDNLAYALEVANTGVHPPITPAIQVQFPITDTFGWWKNERDRRLGKLASNAVAAIEALQPYHRTNTRYRHNLSVLRDLANIDKHRRLLLAVAFSPGVELTAVFGTQRITQASTYSGPLVDGAVTALWRFVGLPPKAVVEMHHNFTFTVMFPEPSPARRRNVSTVLDNICDHIENEVFPALEPFLK